MKRDLFLESLQAQATGNHQRNSALGKRPKSPRERLDEIRLGGSMSDEEYLDSDIDDLGHTTGGHAPVEDDLGMDYADEGPAEESPNLATLQQAAHGQHPEDRPLLKHLQQARERARAEEDAAKLAPKGSAGGSPHLRQEVEQIHQQLTVLLHRLKGIMAQM